MDTCCVASSSCFFVSNVMVLPSNQVDISPLTLKYESSMLSFLSFPTSLFIPKFSFVVQVVAFPQLVSKPFFLCYVGFNQPYHEIIIGWSSYTINLLSQPQPWLATKARGLQGCGPINRPGSHITCSRECKECEGVNPHTPQ